MKRFALTTLILAAFSCPSLADPLIHSGSVLGNGTNAERTAQDTPLINVMQQSGSGIGTGVASAAAQPVNTSGGLVTGSLSLAAEPGFRNRIINGGFRIDQRHAGASQTITAGAALAYTVDRWYAYSTGANVTGQQVANTGASGSPSQYAYQFTGASSVTGIGFGQRIESLNSYDLAGGSATLSLNLADSTLTSVTCNEYYANTADTFGTLASPTVTQFATNTFTVNSTLTNYTATISVPSAATTGIQLVCSVGAQTSGTFTIGNVQLEPGSFQTVFERRPYQVELALAQRYLPAWRDSGSGTDTIGMGWQSGSTTGAANVSFPVPTRVPPTGVVISASNAFVVSSVTATGLSFASAGTNAATLAATYTSGGTAGNAGTFRFNVASAFFYLTGCEL